MKRITLTLAFFLAITSTGFARVTTHSLELRT
jgi:hypothetical protein